MTKATAQVSSTSPGSDHEDRFATLRQPPPTQPNQRVPAPQNKPRSYAAILPPTINSHHGMKPQGKQPRTASAKKGAVSPQPSQPLTEPSRKCAATFLAASCSVHPCQQQAQHSWQQPTKTTTAPAKHSQAKQTHVGSSSQHQQDRGTARGERAQKRG